MTRSIFLRMEEDTLEELGKWGRERRRVPREQAEWVLEKWARKARRRRQVKEWAAAMNATRK